MCLCGEVVEGTVHFGTRLGERVLDHAREAPTTVWHGDGGRGRSQGWAHRFHRLACVAVLAVGTVVICASMAKSVVVVHGEQALCRRSQERCRPRHYLPRRRRPRRRLPRLRLPRLRLRRRLRRRRAQKAVRCRSKALLLTIRQAIVDDGVCLCHVERNTDWFDSEKRRISTYRDEHVRSKTTDSKAWSPPVLSKTVL